MSYFENGIWHKNQYQNLERKDNENSVPKSFLVSIIIGIFLVLAICLWNAKCHQSANTYVVIIDTASKLLHTTSDRFLSFGLDSSLLRNQKTFPIRNAKFINLAQYLSPAFVRIGGTAADCLYFNKILPKTTKRATSPLDGENITNFTLSKDGYVAIYEFTKKAKLRMLFDLNVLIRSNGHWNDSNAKEIISFSKGRDMLIDWQLGNEPNSFKHVFNREVTAKQLGNDYSHLRLLLNDLGYETSFLVGPEVNHVGDADGKGEKYATEFLAHDQNSVDFVTWHQYYLNGREAKIEDFVNPDVFNWLRTQITGVQDAIKLAGKNLQMWISETSSAYGGGAPELSDRFVAGFLWLDKLGYSASTGVNVVIRQSLFGGNYAMVGPDLEPNPDWWVSVFFKQLVSPKVLKLTSPYSLGHVRLYAHCTPESAWLSRVPAVTVYGMNLKNVSVNLFLQGNFSRRSAKIFLYILTSDHLQSRNIMLNFKILKLRQNGSLPAFKPMIINSTQMITLPSYSMAFMVMHGVESRDCTR